MVPFRSFPTVSAAFTFRKQTSNSGVRTEYFSRERRPFSPFKFCSRFEFVLRAGRRDLGDVRPGCILDEKLRIQPVGRRKDWYLKPLLGWVR